MKAWIVDRDLWFENTAYEGPPWPIVHDSRNTNHDSRLAQGNLRGLSKKRFQGNLPDSGPKYYFSNLPVDTLLQQLVETTHQRWAIEQSYREIKNELGFDHFAGRTYGGWNHHTVLVAVTHTFLQMERTRTKKEGRDSTDARRPKIYPGNFSFSSHCRKSQALLLSRAFPPQSA